MIEEAIREMVVAAVREAVGTVDEPLPLDHAAEILGTTTRALQEHARRPEGDPRRLAIVGTKGCRVVWRSELRRWLAAWPPLAAKTSSNDTTAPKEVSDADEDRAALERSAARLTRGRRRPAA